MNTTSANPSSTAHSTEPSTELHVIFGTGPLGMSVMHELVRRGKRVQLVNRSGRATAPSDANVAVLRGDAYNPAFTRAACEGATVVYQCSQPEYHTWAERFPPLQASILNAAARANAKFVIADNLYMYGAVEGRIHEGLPYAAATRKGKVRGQMATAALAAHAAGRVRVAVGRGSDFFGPGVLSSLFGERAIVPALHGKTAQLVGNIELPHTVTFIEDFGKALVTLGEREEALGKAWHVPNDQPTISQREFLAIVFDELGKPAKISTMGKTMLRLGGLFIPVARETVEMMYEFEQPFVVDSSAFEQTFGQTATPLREAVRHTVAWFRAHYA